MTAEEIIKGLESVKTECGKHLDEGFAWICKPIDEAIKALRRKTSTDAVSREAVLDEFDKWVNSREKYYEHPVEFARSFMSLPLVTPKRPKGEWIYDSRHAPFNWECNKCGKSFKADFNFCPNCGADMRGVSECSEENKN